MRQANGVQKRAAERLQLKPTTLNEKIMSRNFWNLSSDERAALHGDDVVPPEFMFAVSQRQKRIENMESTSTPNVAQTPASKPAVRSNGGDSESLAIIASQQETIKVLSKSQVKESKRWREHCAQKDRVHQRQMNKALKTNGMYAKAFLQMTHQKNGTIYESDSDNDLDDSDDDLLASSFDDSDSESSSEAGPPKSAPRKTRKGITKKPAAFKTKSTKGTETKGAPASSKKVPKKSDKSSVHKQTAGAKSADSAVANAKGVRSKSISRGSNAETVGATGPANKIEWKSIKEFEKSPHFDRLAFTENVPVKIYNLKRLEGCSGTFMFFTQVKARVNLTMDAAGSPMVKPGGECLDRSMIFVPIDRKTGKLYTNDGDEYEEESLGKVEGGEESEESNNNHEGEEASLGSDEETDPFSMDPAAFTQPVFPKDRSVVEVGLVVTVGRSGPVARVLSKPGELAGERVRVLFASGRTAKPHFASRRITGVPATETEHGRRS